MLKIKFSPIYLSGCHSLIGPVDDSKIADLCLKILRYSSDRLNKDDFCELLTAMKSLENPEANVEDIADRIAHSCRLHPEIMGLLCSVLPQSVSAAPALCESNASLRAGKPYTTLILP